MGRLRHHFYPEEGSEELGMSQRNGKRAQRALAAIGSACFLGGLALSAAPADAGLYLSLKPATVTGAAQIGALGGNAFTGYTLTLAAGAAATISYDIVVNITDGATTNAVPGSQTAGLYMVRGAVRGSATAGITASHTSYNYTSTISALNTPQAGFTLDPLGQLTGGNAMRSETTATYRPGYTAPNGTSLVLQNGSTAGLLAGGALQAAPAIQGVGPQFGAFSNSDNAATENSGSSRFEVFYNNAVATVPGAVTSPSVFLGTTDLTVARATVAFTAGADTNTATLSFVGGGLNSSDGAFAQWYENLQANRVGLLSSHNAGTASSLPLTIIWAAGGPALVKGDFGGAESPDSSFNTPDGNFDEFDTEGFFLALNNSAAYLALNPSLTAADLITIGDFGGAESKDGSFNTPDGAFDEFDTEGFFLALNNPALYASIQPGARPGPAGAIPEPAALGLLAPAMLALSRRRR
jgi:hypothetical protein